MLFVCQQLWQGKFGKICNCVLLNELNVEHWFSFLIRIKGTMSQLLVKNCENILLYYIILQGLWKSF